MTAEKLTKLIKPLIDSFHLSVITFIFDPGLKRNCHFNLGIRVISTIGRDNGLSNPTIFG